MRIAVKFEELDKRLALQFSEQDKGFEPKFEGISIVTDGGFERGYEKGYKEGQAAGTNPYKGEYTVTPAIHEQTLQTAETYLSDDVTIKAIPYYNVSNTSGGSTVYIGNTLE